MYYSFLATTGRKGTLYKTNTQDINRVVTEMPAIDLPESLINNVQTITTNRNNEPIVGIMRTSSSDPILYRYDLSQQGWEICSVDFPPTLGAFCSTRSPNGTIWVGAKWSYVYRSTDNGLTFSRIDESSIVKKSYPCYYPSYSGNMYDGAIYSIAVDSKNRVYAGTEGLGVVFTDDNGEMWHPADKFICKEDGKNDKDTTSPMYALTRTGNLGAIGIAKDDNIVFNGTDFWHFGAKTSLAFADMKNNKAEIVNGIPDYLITSGLQVTTIITSDNGTMFLHSGLVTERRDEIGIYCSKDGKNWRLFNTGLEDNDSHLLHAALAVDGDTVFMVTSDGTIWYYEISEISSIADTGNHVGVKVSYRKSGEKDNHRKKCFG